MKKYCHLIIIVFVMLSFLRCTTTVSGTGSEVETRCGVMGAVVYESGKPVSGALVRIRPSWYLALDPKDAITRYDTTTDERGFFHFYKVGVDSYTIEINKNGSYGRLIQMTVSSTDTFPIVLPVSTLLPTGVIKGRINLPITDDTARPIIAIYGVEYLEKSLITQDFSFSGIPQGLYNLRLTPYAGSNLILELHNIQVHSDSISDIGTLNFSIKNFFNGCKCWECDSLAVRAILDANGLASIKVDSVVTVDHISSRVSGLFLNGKNVTTIPKDIGSLSFLKVLDISNNRIALLPPEIGYLKSLSEVYANNNDLVMLPSELAYCDSLSILSLANNSIREVPLWITRTGLKSLNFNNNKISKLPDEINRMIYLQCLYLDSNNLATLPQTIISTDIKTFSIKGNKICSIPDEIKSWITVFDSNWNVTQECK